MTFDADRDKIFQLTPSRRATLPLDGRNVTLSFQLTPSRRATRMQPVLQNHQVFQLTPSRRATLTRLLSIASAVISTHALTEGDASCVGNVLIGIEFQLTPSRRATKNPRPLRNSEQLNFNSRPHGGRQRSSGINGIGEIFQLTPSRRAT